ncbi:hypothetical protein NDU88_006799 [Pleurodeles waltl]|uniref:Uncharacterized protein n=1 Tax=Pleurodeles waltl TaxID=8319 RepID=A0AAV7WZ99_PLEWA|nr:hypothetical protein NDU88_006799 [Pleurodeles waltl]
MKGIGRLDPLEPGFSQSPRKHFGGIVLENSRSSARGSFGHCKPSSQLCRLGSALSLYARAKLERPPQRQSTLPHCRLNGNKITKAVAPIFPRIPTARSAGKRGAQSRHGDTRGRGEECLQPLEKRGRHLVT